MSWIITGTEKYETDPYRSQVSLLLHGDGTDGSTTIVDSSPSPKTVTAVGNAQISTAQSKFGGASIAFDASGDYLTVPYSTDLSVETTDFTVEAWIYLNTTGTTKGVVSTRGSENQGYALRINSNNTVQFFYTGSTSLTSSATISATTWTHLAVTRSSNVFYMFFNGVNVGSVGCSNGVNPGNDVQIGRESLSASAVFNGYIDDLRITKGVARYTSNFTPPTAPFPDI